MKKLITVVALVTAGTAFSNAATVALDFEGSSLDYTSSAYAVALITDISAFSAKNGGGFTGAAALTSVIKFGGEWYSSGASGSLGICTNGSSSEHKTGFYGTYAHATRGNSDAVSLGNNLTADAGIFTASTDWDSISAISVAFSADKGISVTSGPEHLYAAVTVLYTNGLYTTYTGSNTTTIAWSGVDNSFKIKTIETSDIYGASLYAYGVEKKDETAPSSLSEAAVLSTVPEPSAFGLLAGIGALALVAARRRRK